MNIPPWMCSVVCAGLNMDDIISGKGNIESPVDTNSSAAESNASASTPTVGAVGAGAEAILNALAASDKKAGSDPLNLISSEESMLINRGRSGVDPSVPQKGNGVAKFNNKN